MRLGTLPQGKAPGVQDGAGELDNLSAAAWDGPGELSVKLQCICSDCSATAAVLVL